MDHLSKDCRSKLMSRVRSKNTSLELKVRRLLFGLGFRYRLHSDKLPGKPDIVFYGRRKVIFVNGCFWHGHKNCRRATLPKSNYDFWYGKIEGNIKRDENNIYNLEKAGWKVCVVWQCEVGDIRALTEKLLLFLDD